MKKVSVAVIGAGARGTVYANYSLLHKDELEITAVAEPNTERRQIFKDLHNIPNNMCFDSWEDMLSMPKLADAIIIATQDKMHFEPAVRSIKKGYHILLEKPMSVSPEECVLLGNLAKEYNKTFTICHVLRYTDFFSTLKKLLVSGRIGRLISIQHNENVGYWHQAHSYVRGNWRNSNESSPMILAKSCHDMDIMLWLAGADCVNLSSFGSLTHFRKENAPENCTERCIDGCPIERECPYSAVKVYLETNLDWPTNVITTDLSLEGRKDALKHGPYGRCVYFCDNNVVDHQVVNLEFANEVTAAFTMCAFTKGSRTIKLMGTNGEIRGDMEKNEIEITDFTCYDKQEVIKLEASLQGHGGGDYKIMHDFVRLLQADNNSEALSSANISVQSHLMAFAAEEARVEKKVINMNEYTANLLNKVSVYNG
jgi:predicted dehydrogenase